MKLRSVCAIFYQQTVLISEINWYKKKTQFVILGYCTKPKKKIILIVSIVQVLLKFQIRTYSQNVEISVLQKFYCYNVMFRKYTADEKITRIKSKRNRMKIHTI